LKRKSFNSLEERCTRLGGHSFLSTASVLSHSLNSGYEVSFPSVVLSKLLSRWPNNFSYPKNVNRYLIDDENKQYFIEENKMNQKDRYIESEIQKIKIIKEYKSPFILDIGGGGEGIIGKLYGSSVVSIDLRKNELDDTNNDSLKIVMDATDLKFIDESFKVVTMFFSLMYMDNKTKTMVVEEAIRVLKQDGVIEIWDIELPKYDGGAKDIFIANLEIELNEEKIKTGYGALLKDNEQTLISIKDLFIKHGLQILEEESIGNAFRLKFIKSSIV